MARLTTSMSLAAVRFVVLAGTTFYWWYCVAGAAQRIGDRDLFTFNAEGKVLLAVQMIVFVGGGVGFSS